MPAPTKPNEVFGVHYLKDCLASIASPVTLSKGARVDKGAMSVTCVLTSATPDRQGDIIEPSGADLSEHAVNPVVMFHHGKTHKLPIGKAEDRDGNHTVRHVKSPNGDDLLLGTTHFAQNDRFANDVFNLVAEDILRGISIGFDPPSDESQIADLGRSPALDRNALHFKDGWKLLEYSHTPIGVNPDALTVTVHKAYEGSLKMHPLLLKALTPYAAARKTVVTAGTPSFEKAKTTAKTAAKTTPKKPAPKPKTVKKGYLDAINEAQGKPLSVPECPTCGGASVPLKRNTIYGYECEKCGGAHGLAESHQKLGWPQFKPKGMHVIVKASDGTYSRMVKSNKSSRTEKAMEEEETDDLFADDGTDVATETLDTDVTDDDTNNETPVDDVIEDDGPPPSVRTLYDASQGILDIRAMIEAGMKKSEHAKARKYAAKLMDELNKCAEDVKKFGDKVQSELAALPSPGADETEEVEAEEVEDEPMEVDEDGGIVTKGYTPKRWAHADFAPVAQTVSTVTDDDLIRRNKALENELAGVKSENKKLEKTLTRALDTLDAIDRANS